MTKEKKEKKEIKVEYPKSEVIARVEQQMAQEDLDKRAKAFNAKLIPLLAEHELSVSAVPFMSQDPHTGAFQIAARPQIMDAKKKPEKDAPVAEGSNDENPKGDLAEA